jgi:hypothetical protein
MDASDARLHSLEFLHWQKVFLTVHYIPEKLHGAVKQRHHAVVVIITQHIPHRSPVCAQITPRCSVLQPSHPSKNRQAEARSTRFKIVGLKLEDEVFHPFDLYVFVDSRARIQVPEACFLL